MIRRFFAYASFENSFESTLIGFSFRSKKELHKKLNRALRDGWFYDSAYVPMQYVETLPLYINIIY